MADFFQKYFGGRIWPNRELNINRQAAYSGGLKYAQDYLDTLGHVQQLQYQSQGAAAAQFVLTAGFDLQGAVGVNLTCTVAAASGSLTVTSNGLDITIQPASGGSTAAAVVAAVNAAFSPNFVTAALPGGSAGGSNITASVAKTSFSRRRPML